MSLEKLLKALFVKKFNQTPPYKHDLAIFAEKCELDLSGDMLNSLKIINEFNIQTRYPDYKNDFYKRCTTDYVKTELTKIEDLREWIKSIIKNMP